MTLHDLIADPWALLNATAAEFAEAAAGERFTDWQDVAIVSSYLEDLREVYRAKAAGSPAPDQARAGVTAFLARYPQNSREELQADYSLKPIHQVGHADGTLGGRIASAYWQLVMWLGHGKVYVCERCGKVGEQPQSAKKRYCGPACNVAALRQAKKCLTPTR